MTKVKSAVVGSMVVHWEIMHCFTLCDLKSAQMKVTYSNLETYVYEFKLGHYAVEETKNISCVEDEGLPYNKQMVQEILLGLQEPL